DRAVDRIDPHPPTPIHLQSRGTGRSITPRTEPGHRPNTEPCRRNLTRHDLSPHCSTHATTTSRTQDETNEALARNRCSSPAQTSPTSPQTPPRRRGRQRAQPSLDGRPTIHLGGDFGQPFPQNLDEALLRFRHQLALQRVEAVLDH